MSESSTSSFKISKGSNSRYNPPEKFKYSNSLHAKGPNKYSNNNNKQYAFNTSRINKMPDEQLIGTLKYHGLNVKGSPDILRKRLKEYMKSQMNHEVGLKSEFQTDSTLYAYFLIIDFEATCDEINGYNFQHEIIEFPIILYDVVLKRKVDVFHAYCKPLINPSLSQFCKTLTNIDQCTIDSAKSFPEVLLEVEQWLNKYHMFTKSFAVVCDCNADMAKFMRIQCDISNIPFPSWCKQWINIMKCFRQFYIVSADTKLNMQKMLSSLGLEFQGRQHSGMFDAENIQQIIETMINDGCQLRINEKLDSTPPHFTASVTRNEALVNHHYHPSNDQIIDFMNVELVEQSQADDLSISQELHFQNLNISSDESITHNFGGPI